MSGSENRHRARARKATPVLAVGLAGALILAIVVGFSIRTAGQDDSAQAEKSSKQDRIDRPSPTESDATPSATPGASDEDGGATGEPSAEVACTNQVDRAHVVLAAARSGVQHMRMHVGAHDKWAAGRISDDVKASTYKRTRLAGPKDLVAYDRATAQLGNDLTSCAGQRTPCAQRMEKIEPALTAARAGMEHWRTHLRNMAAFDQGAFDAARAQRLWSKTIQGSDEATQPFKRAMVALESAPACNPSTP